MIKTSKLKTFKNETEQRPYEHTREKNPALVEGVEKQWVI